MIWKNVTILVLKSGPNQMTPQEFVNRLNGNKYHFTRTCLATGRVDDDEILIPCNPISSERHSSVKLRSIHCYNEDDLFTEDLGVLVAVVKTGAGHLYCDRFEIAQ